MIQLAAHEMDYQPTGENSEINNIANPKYTIILVIK